MKNAMTYVRAKTDRYHQMLLDAGLGFTGRVSVRAAGLSGWVRRQKPQLGQCYENAQKFIMLQKDTALTYCEGYWVWAGAGAYCLHHAWLLKDGKVVDMTGEVADIAHPALARPEADSYYGVSIPSWFVRQQVRSTRKWWRVSRAWFRTMHAEKP